MSKTSIARAPSRLFTAALCGLAVGLLLLTVLAELDRRSFVFELIAQFRWQYCWIAALILFALGLSRRWRSMVVAAVVVAINLLRIGDFGPTRFHQADAKPENKVRLRLLQINVNVRNAELERIINLVQATEPDIFIVEELSPELSKTIAADLPEYRYKVESPAQSPGGIGLYARVALTDLKLQDFAKNGRMGVSGLLVDGESQLQIFGVHLTGPVTRFDRDMQTMELEGLAKTVQTCPRRVVVAGDFNLVPWSRRFKLLRRQADLNDIKNCIAVQGTWPSDEPITRIPGTKLYGRLYLPFVHRLIMLPIDHILVSDGVAVLDERIEPSIGSDHYPLLIDIALPLNQEPATETKKIEQSH